jgi:Amt family ammonium transporter
MLKGRLGYDDTLDAFGVHGVGGFLGTVLLGAFAAKAWNSAGADGLVAGNPAFFGKQLLAALVAVIYSAAGTFVVLKLVGALVGLRVTADEEREGLDINLHGEEGYAIVNSSFGRAETVAVPRVQESTSPSSSVVPAG